MSKAGAGGLVERARSYKPFNHLVDGALVRELAAALEANARALAEAGAEIERLKRSISFKALEAHVAEIHSLRGQRDDALEALRARWRPIETAPTDYTHVIGMDAKGNVSRTWFYAPSSRTRDWLKVPGGGKWKPIYWMPMLDPSEGSGRTLADANPNSNPLSQDQEIAGLREGEREFLEWAMDTLYEINVSNYDHDEVCRLNERSVEVILAMRSRLEPSTQNIGQNVSEDGQHVSGECERSGNAPLDGEAGR